MKQFSLLDLLRVWAAITGLVLVALYFGGLYLGLVFPLLPMLVAAIGGFELFLSMQDLWLKWRASRG